MLWVLPFLLVASDRVSTPGEVMGKIPAGLLVCFPSQVAPRGRRGTLRLASRRECLENTQH